MESTESPMTENQQERVRQARWDGIAVPCSDWHREHPHPHHRWTEDGQPYACPGYRPMADVPGGTWDFNWPQPGCVVTAEHFNQGHADAGPDGRRWDSVSNHLWPCEAWALEQRHAEHAFNTPVDGVQYCPGYPYTLLEAP